MASPDSVPSNAFPGDSAELALLLLQGTCRNNVCVCTPGYSGTYCEVPPACGVINDINGNCCKTGIVSQAGTCCGPVSHCFHRASCIAVSTASYWTLSQNVQIFSSCKQASKESVQHQVTTQCASAESCVGQGCRVLRIRQAGCMWQV